MEIPHILNTYRRALISLVVTLVVGYYAFLVVTSIHNDVKSKFETELQRQETQISRCREEYLRNRCQPDHRVEAL